MPEDQQPPQAGAGAASIAAEAAAAVIQHLGLTGQGAHATAVRPVTIKAPPFWPEEVNLWFVRLEAQFGAAGVTQSKTKFNHVVAALDNATIQEVARVVETPRVGQEYEHVKEALKKAFGRSQAAKDAALLALSGLGDRKPSSLFRHIDALATDRDKLVQALFLAQLPVDVRSMLATKEFDTGEEMAAAADRVMDSRLVGASTSVIMEGEVAVVNKQGSKAKEEPFICRKHRKFGLRARTCQAGCLFADAPLAPSGNAVASRQ